MARKLLVADESIIIQKSVEHILSEKDFKVTFMSEGEEALRSVQNEMPDIVLAGTDLQGMNGYSLCEAIKNHPSLNSVRVILMAPVVDGVDNRMVLDSGADDYLIKPFEPDELHNKLETVMDADRLISELKNRLRNSEKDIEDIKEKIKNETVEKILSDVTPAIEKSIVSEITDIIVKSIEERIPYAVERAVNAKIKEIKDKEKSV
jgi:DNA-binding response OmpR family regulator